MGQGGYGFSLGSHVGAGELWVPAKANLGRAAAWPSQGAGI